jgi:hypothetical protein
MKSELLKPLIKYIILIIINSIIFAPWGFILDFSDDKVFENLGNFQTFGDYAIRVATMLFLAIDFKKANLNYAFLACLSSLFYPLLGIIVFSLLFLEKEKQASA